MKIMRTPDTPIMEALGNDYLVVTEAFSLFVLVGTVESNTSFGSSQCYGHLWQELTVEPGCLIADLAGGFFLQIADEPARKVKIALSDKHPFEKVYVPREDPWPVDKLERTAKVELTYAKRDEKVHTYDEARAMGAAPYGRSIDWVIPEAVTCGCRIPDPDGGHPDHKCPLF